MVPETNKAKALNEICAAMNHAGLTIEIGGKAHKREADGSVSYAAMCRSALWQVVEGQAHWTPRHAEALQEVRKGHSSLEIRLAGKGHPHFKTDMILDGQSAAGKPILYFGLGASIAFAPEETLARVKALLEREKRMEAIMGIRGVSPKNEAFWPAKCHRPL